MKLIVAQPSAIQLILNYIFCEITIFARLFHMPTIIWRVMVSYVAVLVCVWHLIP